MAARRSQQGAGTVEMVLVMPAVLLLITAVVQFAVYYHASHVALAAAQDATRAARLEGAGPNDGAVRARSELDQLGRNLVLSPQVDVTSDGDTVTVTVTGRAPQVVPGLHLAISQHATSPLEKFRGRP